MQKNEHTVSTIKTGISFFSGKRIILGVTGSIAVYKAVDLASKLTQTGAQVDVILTNSAKKFIKPLTFQSVTGRRTYTDSDLWENDAHVVHVGLGHNADLLIIAPCTTNTLAKLACGQSDSLLTVTALTITCPLIIAPAMDGGMFAHAATQGNFDTLRKRGAHIVEPLEGHLASGLIGKGRIPETNDLIGRIRLVLGHHNPITNKKVIIAAGETRKPMDSISIITNSSSEKQGYILSRASINRSSEKQGYILFRAAL